ncbi:unnamed protein product [Caretta caretta]
MVQFYAPWCPACQQIEAAWENFAKESEHLDTTVGKVDVTQEPGLSGRFFVTTLPTIYHAKDGVFRRYRGSRTSEDLQGYVLERKWEAVEPVAGWKSPSSLMMHGMAGLFHLSGCIRQIHSYFTGTLGIHVWGSYAIFILATLLIGLILGLILVLLADCFCPSKARYREEASVEWIEKENAELTAVEEVEEAEELSANELEEAAEEKKDISDGEDGARSSEEANSSEDGSEEDSAVDEGSGTEETEDICEQPPSDSEIQSSTCSKTVVTLGLWRKSTLRQFPRQQVSFYQLVVQEVDTNSTDMAIEKLSPWFFQIASNSVELRNLTPNVEYLLRVHAVNIAGAWEWCKPFKPSLPLSSELFAEPQNAIAFPEGESSDRGGLIKQTEGDVHPAGQQVHRGCTERYIDYIYIKNMGQIPAYRLLRFG